MPIKIIILITEIPYKHTEYTIRIESKRNEMCKKDLTDLLQILLKDAFFHRCVCFCGGPKLALENGPLSFSHPKLRA